MQDAATIITAVGTAFAAILTALLGGSRWLLKVWFNYQLKVKAEEKKQHEQLITELKTELRIHARVLGELKLSIESGAAKFLEHDKKLDSHQQKLEATMVNYKSNIDNANKVIVAVQAYVQKTEEWKRDMETRIIQLKNGNVMFKGKKP